MIVKFDHLSYSCSEEEEECVIKEFCSTGDYRLQFSEKIKNVKIKTELMQHPSEFHGLTMLQPTDKCETANIPIEITSYPKVKGYSPYNLKEGIIEFKTKDSKESMSFFKCLGFQEGEKGIMVMKTILDKKPYYIQLVEADDAYACYLDVRGFSSMAWIVTKIEEYVEHLRKQKIKVTDIEDVFVNKRKLKVCFAFGRCGEIIELIGVDR